jgi:hypothetical protein
MQPRTLTPAQEELLNAIRARSIGGVAVSLFRIGVEAGQEYHRAYDNYQALKEMRIVRARRLENASGRPLAITIRSDDEHICIQPTGDIED